jgi:poly(A) polymerase
MIVPSFSKATMLYNKAHMDSLDTAPNINTTEKILDTLRDATRGTEFEDKLYLVGGCVRDKILGNPTSDYDLVLEGDAIAVARLLWKKRVASHPPVEFPAFGTTMVHVGGLQIEIVTARAETYRTGSRKPVVVPGTLQSDAERRDFTCNTLMENLHTSEVLDLTGRGRKDLDAGVLRTPLDAIITFTDDPLRMLRACRFAAKLGFVIEANTYRAIKENAHKLSYAHGIAFERIKEEFSKMLMAKGAINGLRQLLETGLLAQFAPELLAMVGVTQNAFHHLDVWEHSLAALGNLPSDAPLEVRLATLLHDCGKPQTRSVDTNGDVHFYEHEHVGADMARAFLNRLRYPNEIIDRVATLVNFHMRFGAYDKNWSDSAVRRLIRTVGTHKEDLFCIAAADVAACNTEIGVFADLDGLREHMQTIEQNTNIAALTSPLSGDEIRELLGAVGPQIGKIKNTLTDLVVAGELAPDDKEGALKIAREMV